MTDKLARFQNLAKFYKNATRLGSNRILLEFLNIKSDIVLPLSIAHGVDFNHISFPMEAMSIEPIHWAYNENIYLRSREIKPSIKIPHPWLLLEKTKRTDQFPLLIIGPPPSKQNDENLLNLLLSSGFTDFHILIKDKEDINYSSAKFWHAHGIKTISAGTRDDKFYIRLSSILHMYKKLIGCSISSALVFGASIGCELELLEDYFFEAYETINRDEISSSASNLIPQFARKIINDNQQNQKNFSKEILGEQYRESPENIRNNLFEILESLDSNFFINKKFSRTEKYIRHKLITFTGRTTFADIQFFDMLKKIFSKKVLKIRVNQIDAALFGRNEKNYSFKVVPFIKNVTDPGKGA